MRFRHNVAVPLAGVAAFVALIPLAGSRWYLAPLLLIPVLGTVWGWRSGVDVDPGGLTVRAMLGSRRLPWPDVTGFSTQGRRVYALTGDAAVALPSVTPDDVPRLLEAGGQDLDRLPADADEPSDDRDEADE